MKNFIIEYKPKIKIHLFDGSEIITDKKHELIIIEACKRKTVITVWDITITWANISKIEPLQYDDYNQIDFKIPEKYKKSIDARSKLFIERTTRAPKEETIKMWCQRLDRWWNLDPEGLQDNRKDNTPEPRKKAKKFFAENPTIYTDIMKVVLDELWPKEWFTKISEQARDTFVLSKCMILARSKGYTLF